MRIMREMERSPDKKRADIHIFPPPPPNSFLVSFQKEKATRHSSFSTYSSHFKPHVFGLFLLCPWCTLFFIIALILFSLNFHFQILNITLALYRSFFETV